MRTDAFGTWLTLKESAERLRTTVEQVEEYIDNREIDYDEDENGAIYAALADVDDMAALICPAPDPNPHPALTPTLSPRKSKTANRKSRTGYLALADGLGAPFPSASEYADHPKSPGGVPLIPVKEAAKLLKITARSVYRILERGQLDGYKEEGRWSVRLDSCERYAGFQQHWASRDGGWTPFGRQFKKRRSYIPHPKPSSSSSSDDVHGSPTRVDARESAAPDPYWISANEAADLLQLNICYFRKLALKRNLTREKSRVPLYLEGERQRNRPPRRMTGYLMHEVVNLMDERDRTQKTMSPSEWKRKSQRPIVRANVEPPTGDRLISVKQAADLLGVRVPSVVSYIARGRLFAWQQKPGKRGSKVWLSERQVERYRDNPDRLRRRGYTIGAEVFGAGPANPADTPEWVEESGLLDEERKPKRPNRDREYGEYFTTRQVARVLGICPASIRELRRRGRLIGYRSHNANPNSIGAWWFYRKEDVYALKEDRQYAFLHKRSKATQQRPGVPRELTEEELYEFIKINAFGRPPRGQIIETGWSWGDSRLYHISPFVVDPADPPGGWWDPETWHELLK